MYFVLISSRYDVTPISYPEPSLSGSGHTGLKNDPISFPEPAILGKEREALG